MPTELTELTEVSDYYSETYDYSRYPARVAGEPGVFQVWHGWPGRNVTARVTWSPEIVALVAAEYHNEAWHAERAERAARPELARGESIWLGPLLIEVPQAAGTYTTGVPCRVLLDTLEEQA